LSSQFAASTNRRFKFQKRGQLFIRVHNETLSIVALGGFLEGSALGPFVKVDALTRERFRITPQYFVANDSGQGARFSSMLI
jgi:hypothetical protein